MNRTMTAIAAIMLMMVFAVGCTKPNDPNNGGNGNGSNNGENEEVPYGAINGLFSVNDSVKVYFSHGNLQYQPSNNVWRFATNQYDLLIMPEDMSSIDDMGLNYVDLSAHYNSSFEGWIDLFGWGTSGNNHGAICYQPWSTSIMSGDYYAYGDSTNNLYDRTGSADWGYNVITNGGNERGKWRTLTMDEFEYVFNLRNTSSGIRYAKGMVNNVNGVILLPDNWDEGIYNLSFPNTNWAPFNRNLIDVTQWEVLENAGAVFLPASGFRFGTLVYVDSTGIYWSSSNTGNAASYGLSFRSDFLNTSLCRDFRDGLSVRLVCPVE